MKKSIKKRNWCFIVYPTKEQLDKLDSCNYDGSDGYGSAPDDWIEILKKSGVEFAVSPLHDKDLLEDNSGKTKKPHYHVIVCYGNTTTFNNVVKSLTEKLNSPIPQPLEQVRGYYKYLTHKDNADKYQYDEKEIIVGNGFNIANYTELTKSEVLKEKQKLQMLIREEGFVEYSEFMDYLLDNEMFLEYDIASNHTYFFDKYISSKRHSNHRKNIVLVNEATGEIIK